MWSKNNLRFAHMKRTAVGGSAMPMALIAKFMDNYGVEVRHGWGMTETHRCGHHEQPEPHRSP